jgi:DcaP outer membrane protein
MSRTIILAVAAIVGTMCVCDRARANADLADENAQLKSRVDTLEKQVQGLTSALSPEEQSKAKAIAEGKQSVWSKLDMQFYGFIKGDAAYDNSRTTSGNYIVWVNNESGRGNDDEFSMTANQTRLGLNINGPNDKYMQTSGKIEFDFYGSGASENKAKIQMRHAYVQLRWPDHGLSLLAGQTWDVISPLNPTTLNYSVLWDGGNIGYRRPQIRLTKDLMLSGDTSVKFQGAISRTIGRSVAVPGVTSESGEDAGFPTVQGRIGMTKPWLAAGSTTFGISGHMGQEEYDVSTTADTNRNFDSWSVNFDLVQPIMSWMTLKAEVFKGENLDSYLGGIGQGVRAVKTGTTTVSHDREISSKGGWCALGFGPWDQWSFNTGIGIDDVDVDDVNVGDRTLNRAVFANAIYALNKHADVGVEISHWRTDYRGRGDADDVRLQTSLTYKF